MDRLATLLLLTLAVCAPAGCARPGPGVTVPASQATGDAHRAARCAERGAYWTVVDGQGHCFAKPLPVR